DNFIAGAVCRRLGDEAFLLEERTFADHVRSQLDECLAIDIGSEVAPIRAYCQQLRAAAVVRRLSEAGIKFWEKAAAGTILDYEDYARKFSKYAAQQESRLISMDSTGPETIAGLMQQTSDGLDNLKESYAKRTVGCSAIPSIANAIGAFERGDVYAI